MAGTCLIFLGGPKNKFWEGSWPQAPVAAFLDTTQ